MKKKIAKMLLALAIFLPCLLMFTACGTEDNQGNAKLTSISVETTSTEFELIDNTITIPYGSKIELDDTNFVVTANYDDGTTEVISVSTSEETVGYTFTSTIPTENAITPRGDYTITFSYAELQNVVVNVRVVKADVDMSGVRWDYLNPFTYNGQKQTVSVTNLPTGVTVEYDGVAEATDAGKYSVTAIFTYADTENYNPIDNMELVDWEIKPATYTTVGELSFEDYDLTYNGKEQFVTLDTSKLDTNVQLVNNVTEFGATNAGTHYVNVALKHKSSNYVLAEDKTVVRLSWQIAQVKLTVTAKSNNVTYGTQASGNGVEYDGFVNGENESVLVGTLGYTYPGYSIGTEVDATCYILPNGLESNNYYFDYKQGVLTVVPATISITGATWNYTEAYTYSADNTEGYKPVLTGLPSNVTETYKYFVGDVEVTPIDAGDYTAVATLASNNKNYVLDEEDVEWELSYTINQAEIDTTGIALVEDEFTYDGTERSVSVNGDTLPSTVTQKSIKNNVETDAGDYKAIVVLTSTNTNYKDTTIELSWKINQATIDLTSVTWNYTEAYTYSEDNTEGFKPVLVGLSSSITVTYNYISGSASVTPIDAGDYTAVATLVSNNDNYVMAEDDAEWELEYTINPATIDLASIEWDYAEPYTYSADNTEGFKPVLVGLPSNVTVTYNYVNGSASVTPINADDYTAVATLESNDDNYAVAEDNVRWELEYTINPATIDLTNVDWDYTEHYTYSEDNTEGYKPVLTGLPSDVTANYNYLSGSVSVTPINAGEYIATATLESNNKNYVIDEDDVEWELTYHIDTIKIDLDGVDWSASGDIVYNGNPIELKLSNMPEGELYEEKLSVIYNYYQITATGDKELRPINVGEYYVTVQVSSITGNYEVINDNFATEFSYEIVPIEIDVADIGWTHGNEIVYTGDAIKPKLTVDEIAYTTISYAYTKDEDGVSGGVSAGIDNPTDVGLYHASVTLTLPDETNYVFVKKNFSDLLTYNIIKADIDIKKMSWSVPSYLVENRYDGENVYYYSAALEYKEEQYNISVVNGNPKVELSVNYDGDNGMENITPEFDEDHILLAYISLTDHENYNDCAFTMKLSYRIYDKCFTSILMNGDEISFAELWTLNYLPLGTTFKFNIAEGYSFAPEFDPSVTEYELVLNTLNQYLDQGVGVYKNIGTDEIPNWWHTFSTYFNTYLIDELTLANDYREITCILNKESYNDYFELEYGETTIDLNFDESYLEEYTFGYNASTDYSWNSGYITSLPFTIDLANTRWVDLWVEIDGQQQIIKSFAFEKFTPVDQFMVEYIGFDGCEGSNGTSPMSDSLDISNAVPIAFNIIMKNQYADWKAEVFTDEYWLQPIDITDLYSHNKLYIVIRKPDNSVFTCYDFRIKYRFSPETTFGLNNISFIINPNEQDDDTNEFTLNVQGGEATIEYYTGESNELTISSLINGMTSYELTKVSESATYKLVVEYDGKTYEIDFGACLTLINSEPYADYAGSLNFTDSHGVQFTHDYEKNVLYVADINELVNNIDNIKFNWIQEGYELTGKAVVDANGEQYTSGDEAYLKLVFTPITTDDGFGEDDTTGDDNTTGENGSGTEGDGYGSGSETPGFDFGGNSNIGLLSQDMGYNAGNIGTIVCYVRVCVDNEFKTNTKAMITVRDEAQDCDWYYSMESGREITANLGCVLYVEAENELATITLRNSTGDFEVISRGILIKDGMNVRFTTVDTYTLTITALDSNYTVSCTIKVVDPNAQPDEPETPDYPEVPDDTVVILEDVFILNVAGQTFAEDITNKGPVGDLYFHQDEKGGNIYEGLLTESVWNYVVEKQSTQYLTITSLTSAYYTIPGNIYDGNGVALEGSGNWELQVLRDEDGIAYIHFYVVTLDENGDDVRADFYLYLEETFDLFTLTIDGKNYIAKINSEGVISGDFKFVVEAFTFNLELDSAELTCVNDNKILIDDFTSQMFELISAVDCYGNEITSFKEVELLLIDNQDETLSAHFTILVNFDGVQMPIQFYITLVDEYAGGDDDETEDESNSYKQIVVGDIEIAVGVLNFFGNPVEFEYAESNDADIDGIITIDNCDTSTCIEVEVDDYSVVICDYDGNLISAVGGWIDYYFQQEGTYYIVVLDEQEEFVAMLEVVVSGEFDAIISVNAENDGERYQLYHTSNGDMVGTFDVTLDATNMIAPVLKLKAFIGSEHDIAESSTGRTLTIDSIGGVYKSTAYYDYEHTKPITNFENVELAVETDDNGFNYVRFYLCEYVEGEEHDALVMITLYLCDKEDYLVEYPTNITVGTNSFDIRARQDDIMDHGVEYYSFVDLTGYVYVTRESLGTDENSVNATITWSKFTNDYSYAIINEMLIYSLILGDVTFEELVEEGLVYYYATKDQNSITIPLEFYDNQASLVFMCEGYNGGAVMFANLLRVVIVVEDDNNDNTGDIGSGEGDNNMTGGGDSSGGSSDIGSSEGSQGDITNNYFDGIQPNQFVIDINGEEFDVKIDMANPENAQGLIPVMNGSDFAATWQLYIGENNDIISTGVASIIFAYNKEYQGYDYAVINGAQNYFDISNDILTLEEVVICADGVSLEVGEVEFIDNEAMVFIAIPELLDKVGSTVQIIESNGEVVEYVIREIDCFIPITIICADQPEEL